LEDAVAEDITALTFEKALRALPGYEPRGVSFGAWLYRIARNELISYQRKQRWFTFLRPNHASPLNLDWLVERNEEVAELRQALVKLFASPVLSSGKANQNSPLQQKPSSRSWITYL